MPSDGSPELVVAGRRLRTKLVIALTLSSVVPLLVLAYLVRSFVLPSLAAKASPVFGGVQILVASTVIGMIAGAYIIWDVGRTVARIAEMLGSERAISGLGRRKDEVGHAVGDDTLRDVAQILMKHSRGINVVSRYGGDEFAVLLVETSKAGARLYADRIREVVAKYPFSHGKVITASFGVASLPDDEATTAEDLFRAADEALYAAKRAGKNQVAAASGSPAKVS